MSRLVLTRKAGQVVRLETAPGVYAFLSVAYVGRDFAKFEFHEKEKEYDTEQVDVKCHWKILPGVTVHLVSIQFSTAKLVFEAPPSIKIIRTELLTEEAPV